MTAKERVLGIGGFFFRAREPQRLAQWYEAHLGVALTPGDYETEPWAQEAGPTVFQPFPNDTSYFARATQQWMLNFRVRDLDAMLRQLREAGVACEHEGDEPNGRFARLVDPEGNPVQLWEPRTPAAAGSR